MTIVMFFPSRCNERAPKKLFPRPVCRDSADPMSKAGVSFLKLKPSASQERPKIGPKAARGRLRRQGLH